MPELREPTEEELKALHKQLQREHRERHGPMITALHDRLTEAQRRAFFDPIYVPSAMNNFAYRRAFYPDGGVFANKGVLAQFFCIVDAATRVPCWVVRFQIGEKRVTDDNGRPHFKKIGKIRPAMVKVLDELAASMLEGCGRDTKTRTGKGGDTYFVYRAFTKHERQLVFPMFLNSRGVNIGPVDVIEKASG